MKRLMLAMVMVCGLGLALVGVAQAPAALSSTSGPGYHPCTNPTTVTSDPGGHAGYGGARVVSQDIWNDINISQTLYSCAENSWYVKASASASGDNGAVQSFPDSNETLSSAMAFSSITSMTSNYRAYGTPSCSGNDYEYASDDWIGGPTEWSGPSTELMIWHFDCNQTPAGNDIGTVALDGLEWQVWLGGSTPPNIVTFRAVDNYTSGQTNVLDFLQYINAQGWAGSDPHVWQDSEGAEICFSSGTIQLGLQAFNLRINNQPAKT